MGTLVMETETTATMDDSDREQLWPMGAVTRRTGVGEHTLRAWERRFGFPDPVRLPSGHRRYPPDQVRRLILINTALGCGYRAGDVVPLPLDRLKKLLRECGAFTSFEAAPAADWVASLLEAGRRFDREAVASRLHLEASRLGVSAFLRDRAVPMLAEIGGAWARGELEVAHEHFLSHVLEDCLRSLRAPLEGAAQGRPVVLASLEDEQHALGLHMVALAVTAAGRKAMLLGAQTPVAEIIRAAESTDAAAVGISVSIYSAGEDTMAALAILRAELPRSVRLWVGGAGAGTLGKLPDGAEHLSSLDDLQRELPSLPPV
jgi:DNA-binding transcriptional MerR regulator/methylmalonyl-CoA mutase cobalamin-binding subunit